MLYKKIVLAGGNGYLGSVFAGYYKNKADEVIILSREPKADNGNIKTISWNGKTSGKWIAALQDADMLINLCGKNVNCRYTAKNKNEIMASRTTPTHLLGKVISRLSAPPKLWINVTSATIYRHAEDRPQDEATGEIGLGFSVDVCRMWEQVFFNAHTPGTRKVALRMGIVLGREDGAFPRLHNLVKLGLGGSQGNGRQMVSWIHEQDAARSTEWLLNHEELSGIYNCTSPRAITNTDLMRTIRKACHMPFGLPAPKWLLEIGAAIIGTETELILKSRWVKPQRLLESGFRFAFEKVEDAVKEIVGAKQAVDYSVKIPHPQQLLS